MPVIQYMNGAMNHVSGIHRFNIINWPRIADEPKIHIKTVQTIKCAELSISVQKVAHGMINLVIPLAFIFGQIVF